MQNYEEELINLLNDKEVSNKSNIIADINTFKSIDIEKEIDKCGYNKKEVSDFILKTQKYTEENSKLEINEKMIEESYIAARSILLENKISKEKEIIFLFGLPASGKTTILNKIIKKYDKNFYILDSDDYKTGLKNKKGNIIFNSLQSPDLEGIDVQTIQEASSKLSRLVFESLIDSNYNVAYTKIGDNLQSCRDIIQKVKEKEYKIHIHFVYTSIETALQRNIKRFNSQNKAERRLVPPNLYFEWGYKPLFNFFKLLEIGDCNDYTLWDSEHLKNDEAQIIFEKTTKLNKVVV